MLSGYEVNEVLVPYMRRCCALPSCTQRLAKHGATMPKLSPSVSWGWGSLGSIPGEKSCAQLPQQRSSKQSLTKGLNVLKRCIHKVPLGVDGDSTPLWDPYRWSLSLIVLLFIIPLLPRCNNYKFGLPGKAAESRINY